MRRERERERERERNRPIVGKQTDRKTDKTMRGTEGNKDKGRHRFRGRKTGNGSTNRLLESRNLHVSESLLARKQQ